MDEVKFVVVRTLIGAAAMLFTGGVLVGGQFLIELYSSVPLLQDIARWVFLGLCLWVIAFMIGIIIRPPRGPRL